MKKYTLITGASSGIGRELALIAAREKRNLLLVARSKAALESVQTKILKQFGKKLDVKILATDLSKPSAAEKITAFCKEQNILVDELINNAGFGDYGNFANSDLPRQLNMVDLNIRSLTELTHRLLPDMIKKNSGKIMNIGSVASFLPGPLMSTYFASKAYVLSFSEALAEELSGTGVTVTCLCPGSTKTNFGKSAHVSATHSTANPKTTAREVAEFGWHHMQQGTRVAIHGRTNRITIQLTKFIPRTLLAKLVKKVQK
jgi:hypothetical protein